ncbi:MAG: efflux RND transporter periplasmic adaptor subunit [Alphaproteobacteria bacterium]|nr:efflux RND transporter periplasmic adaptor subunit [Alphaproteobacteria bacterium]
MKHPRSWSIVKVVLALLIVAGGIGLGLVIAMADQKLTWMGIPARPAPGALSPRFEAHSEMFDIVGVDAPDGLELYLDRYANSAPVGKAVIEITVEDGLGASTTATAVESGEGLYTLTPSPFGKPGRYTVTMTITAGDDIDLLGAALNIATSEPPRSFSLGALLITGASGAVAGAVGVLVSGLFGRRRAALIAPLLALALISTAEAAPSGKGHSHGEGGPVGVDESTGVPANSPRRMPDGAVFVPKPTQRMLNLRTGVSKIQEAARVIRIIGRIAPDPAASGRIQASLNGRIMFGEGGVPSIGRRVTRGELLASVVPVVNPIDRGNITQQMGQIESEIDAVKAQLEELNRDALSPAVMHRVEQARLELESLHRRRAAIALVIGDREMVRVALKAPADGLIASSNVVAGQIVSSQDVLFEIIDPNRLWVEAAAYVDAVQIERISGATAVTSSGRSYELTFISRGPKLRQQAIPLNFRINQPDSSLSVSAPVTVFIRTPDVAAGIILPQSAVVRNQVGQNMVWEKVGGERFEPILVRSEPIDGQNVLIQAGLGQGRRIVIEGANLLNQIH